MKFTITKKVIIDAMTSIQSITGRNSGFGMTAYVKLQCKDGVLTVTATDLTTTSICQYDAAVETPGEFLIHSAALYRTCKFAAGDDVSINCDSKGANVSSGGNTTRLLIADPQDFPDILDITHTESVEVESDDMLRALEIAAAVPATVGEKRAHIAGALFSASAGVLTIVSTEQGRLHEIKVPCVGDAVFAGIAPKTALVDLGKCIARSSRLSVAMTGSDLIVRTATRTIVSRLLEGRFPAYQQVLAERDGAKSVTVDRSLLMSALSRMMVVDDSMEMCINDDVMSLSAVAPEVGDTEEDVKVEAEGLHDFSAIVKCSYVYGICKCKDGETVVFDVVDGKNPIILRGDTENYAIMPMRN